jgi:hypothetical protein
VDRRAEQRVTPRKLQARLYTNSHGPADASTPARHLPTFDSCQGPRTLRGPQATGERFIVEGTGTRARRIIATLRNLEPRARLYYDKTRSVWALSVPGKDRPPSNPIKRLGWEVSRNSRHIFEGTSWPVDMEGERFSEWIKPSKRSRSWWDQILEPRDREDAP